MFQSLSVPQLRFRRMKKQIKSRHGVPIDEEITLSQPDTTLPKCVFRKFASQQIALRRFDVPRIHLESFGAGSVCLTQKSRNEFRRRTVTNRFAKPASLHGLPTVVFNPDFSGVLKNPIDELTMLVLSCVGSPTLQIGNGLTKTLVGLGINPSPNAFFDRTVRIEVIGVGGSFGTIHRPLKTSNFLRTVLDGGRSLHLLDDTVAESQRHVSHTGINAHGQIRGCRNDLRRRIPFKGNLHEVFQLLVDRLADNGTVLGLTPTVAVPDGLTRVRIPLRNMHAVEVAGVTHRLDFGLPDDALLIVLPTNRMKASGHAFESRLAFTFKQPGRPGSPQVVRQRLFDVGIDLLGSTTGLSVSLKNLLEIVG